MVRSSMDLVSTTVAVLYLPTWTELVEGDTGYLPPRVNSVWFNFGSKLWEWVGCGKLMNIESVAWVPRRQTQTHLISLAKLYEKDMGSKKFYLP